jgi:hypothetical protein
VGTSADAMKNFKVLGGILVAAACMVLYGWMRRFARSNGMR